MSRLALAFSAVALAALVSAAYPVLSRGVNAGRMLWAQDDPAQLSELALDDQFDAARAAREIDAALTANDPELADSFVELARERAIAIDPDLIAKAGAAKKAAAKALPGGLCWARPTASPRSGGPRWAISSYSAICAMRRGKAFSLPAASRWTSRSWACRSPGLPSRPAPT